MSDLTSEDLRTKKVLLRHYIVELDVHPFVTEAEFEPVWNRKVAGHFGKVPVYYASLEDLIEMKKAAGRAKDLEDLKVLTMLKEKATKRST